MASPLDVRRRLSPRLLRCLWLLLVLAAAWWLAPATAEAAVLKRVHSGSTVVNNSTTATSVTLDLPDASKAFVVCYSRTTSGNSNKRVTCVLSDNTLAIKPDIAPGASVMTVTWFVAEFTSGVSVQRGTVSYTTTGTAPSTAPTLSPAVDCTKSFVVLGGDRNADGNATNDDEEFTFQAVLGSQASPCTSGTTTALEITRNDINDAATVAWQVVTMDSASVQRGVICIGSTTACATVGVGFTQGKSIGATLSTAVDTTKSFILVTRKAGTAVAGIDEHHMVRGDFTAAGSSVTGLSFVRGTTSTTANVQANISWQVVSLNDGSSVIRPAVPLSGTTTPLNATVSAVDQTTTVPFFSLNGPTTGNAAHWDDLSASARFTTDTNLAFERVSGVTAEISYFVVSFNRCANSKMCSWAATASLSAGVTLNWSPIYDPGCTLSTPSTCHALILRKTSSISDTPTNGTAYTVGNTLAGTSCAANPTQACVIFNGSGSTALLTTTDGQSPASNTTYYYRIYPKTAATTYVTNLANSISEVTARIPTGNTVWVAAVAGGSMLKPPIAGFNASYGVSGIYGAGNSNQFVGISPSTGAQTWSPQVTSGAVQGWLTWVPTTDDWSQSAVVGGDSTGRAYAINPADGSILWSKKLSELIPAPNTAESVQAAVSMQRRAFVYTGSGTGTCHPSWSQTRCNNAIAAGNSFVALGFDLYFVATRNSDGVSNKVFALRGDTGALVWTFNDNETNAVDYIVGQPWVDYERNLLYVPSRAGDGSQISLWALNTLTGAVVNTVGIGHLETSLVLSFDGNTIYVGAMDGKLYAINAADFSVKWTNLSADASITGLIYEDFETSGKTYFKTTNGKVWSVLDDCSGLGQSPGCLLWSTTVVSGGSVASPIVMGSPGDSFYGLYVGGSDGKIHLLDPSTGVENLTKQFTVGDGTSTVGDLSSDGNSDRIFAGAGNGIYRITIPLP